MEAILERFQNYPNPFQQQRSRAQSGYSASRDEATHPGDQAIEVDLNYDLELGVELNDLKKHKRKEIIVLPSELIDNKKNTVEMVNMPLIRKYYKKFKTAIFILLLIALLALIGRNIYLEVKVKSFPDKIFSLNKEINELDKRITLMGDELNECKYGDEGGMTPSSKENSLEHLSLVKNTSP